MARARAGDREAFDLLVAEFREKLLAWIQSRMSAQLQSKVDAEDVLQETLVWAFRSIEKLEWKGEEAFASWLISIARHAILKEASRQERRRECVLEREPVDDLLSPSRSLRRTERFERLREALSRLSLEHRKVIELARIQGVPIKKIAVEMNRSPQAVTQLIRRALAKLREDIGDTESLGLPPDAFGVRDGEPGGGENGA